MSDLSSKILSRVTCIQCMVGTALVVYLGKSAFNYFSSGNADKCGDCCNPSCACEPCECGPKATQTDCCDEKPCCKVEKTSLCCIEGKACCEAGECCEP